MSVGKNAIKRVINDGYANVKSVAPDMENSNVIANPAPQVVEKLIKPVEEKAANTVAKKAPAKKATPKKTMVKKPVCNKECKTEMDGFARVGFGEDLPYYLL